MVDGPSGMVYLVPKEPTIITLSLLIATLNLPTEPSTLWLSLTSVDMESP